MEYRKCYVYTPEEERPPRKRQHITGVDTQPQLFDRLKLFRKIWAEQKRIIESTLNEADDATQERIVTFIASCARVDSGCTSTIPTGLIVAGPSIASHGSLFARLGEKIRNVTKSSYAVLTSSECQNLKTLLKTLIKKVTSRIDDDDDDDGDGDGDDAQRPTNGSIRGPKILNFDLQHVQQWQKKAKVDHIVVALQDSEAFDNGLLIDLIDLIASWSDRLPFVLLFGIATSAESFEDRLTGKVLRYLNGQKFDVTQSDDVVEELFAATIVAPELPLRVGPSLSRRMLDRQRDHIQNVQDLVDGLKYAYMSHFYAKVPSILLDQEVVFEDLELDVFEAVRNLPSFKVWVEDELEQGHAYEARKLLESDRYLYDRTIECIHHGRICLSGISEVAILLTHIRNHLQLSPTRLSTIWNRAMANDLLDSPLLRETMLSIKKLSSEKLVSLLGALQDVDVGGSDNSINSIHAELEKLIDENRDLGPLRSQDDVRNDSLRTTVVAQKVLLSKRKAALSQQDQAYTELVERFHNMLQIEFSTTLLDPNALNLSEILIYDQKSPHTEVFQPKPRFVVERALSAPHDYLGCDCCGADHGGDATLGSSQPPTAILYQLYLESGAIINASDLFTAFNALVGEGNQDDPRTTALFQRALAELRYLGLVKPTRKKNDHIAKLMWKGL